MGVHGAPGRQRARVVSRARDCSCSDSRRHCEQRTLSTRCAFCRELVRRLPGTGFSCCEPICSVCVKSLPTQRAVGPVQRLLFGDNLGLTATSTATGTSEHATHNYCGVGRRRPPIQFGLALASRSLAACRRTGRQRPQRQPAVRGNGALAPIARAPLSDTTDACLPVRWRWTSCSIRSSRNERAVALQELRERDETAIDIAEPVV